MHQKSIDGIRKRERRGRLQSGHAEGAGGARFARGGGDGGNAGRTGQQKGGKGGGRGRAHGRSQPVPEKEGQRARHALLGGKAREGGQRHLPAGDAHGVKQVHQPAAEHGQHAPPALRAHVGEGKVEGEQQPHRRQNGGNHRARFGEKPAQRAGERAPHRAQRRPLQAGHLHGEGLLAPPRGSRNGRGDEHARQVQPQQREKAPAEKGGDEHEVDGQLGAARQVREDGDDAPLQTRVFQPAGGADGRRRAAEAHQQRKDRPARQPHAAEQAVRMEGQRGHAAALFEHKQGGVEDEKLRQEGQHGRDAAGQGAHEGRERRAGGRGQAGEALPADTGHQRLHGAFEQGARHARPEGEEKHRQKTGCEQRQRRRGRVQQLFEPPAFRPPRLPHAAQQLPRGGRFPCPIFPLAGA